MLPLGKGTPTEASVLLPTPLPLLPRPAVPDLSFPRMPVATPHLDAALPPAPRCHPAPTVHRQGSDIQTQISFYHCPPWLPSKLTLWPPITTALTQPPLPPPQVLTPLQPDPSLHLALRSLAPHPGPGSCHLLRKAVCSFFTEDDGTGRCSAYWLDRLAPTTTKAPGSRGSVSLGTPKLDPQRPQQPQSLAQYAP